MKRTPLRRLGKRGKADREALAKLRHAVVFRDNHICQRCLKSSCWPLDLHHIQGRAQGGEHTLENLVTLGRPCHTAITDHTALDWKRWVRSRKP